MNEEPVYVCIGICQPDPDSGYCMGCGRPPLDSPEIVAVREDFRRDPAPRTPSGDPDSPA